MNPNFTQDFFAEYDMAGPSVCIGYHSAKEVDLNR